MMRYCVCVLVNIIFISILVLFYSQILVDMVSRWHRYM